MIPSSYSGFVIYALNSTGIDFSKDFSMWRSQVIIKPSYILPLRVNVAVFTPITWPYESISGPPEFPALILTHASQLGISRTTMFISNCGQAVFEPSQALEVQTQLELLLNWVQACSITLSNWKTKILIYHWNTRKFSYVELNKSNSSQLISKLSDLSSLSLRLNEPISSCLIQIRWGGKW